MRTEAARRRYRALVGAAGVIGVDYATKLAATIDNGRRTGLFVPVRNPSFSLGVAHGPRTVELAAMLLGVAAAAVYVMRQMQTGRLSGWVAGLLLGGALSNLVDRAVSGSVHDFLATPWVVFNIADVAVVVGIIGCAFAALKTLPRRASGEPPSASVLPTATASATMAMVALETRA